MHEYVEKGTAKYWRRALTGKPTFSFWNYTEGKNGGKKVNQNCRTGRLHVQSPRSQISDKELASLYKSQSKVF